MNTTTFYVVNHTHWDREWQKTFHEYRTRLIKFMDNLIETLEEDDQFHTFMLDGQTSLIEDYLSIKPKMHQRLKELIQNKRITIGPWYVQPDEFLPSGESLLRNLLIGEQISREFGPKMNVGYLPDSFGQSRFIPQILNQFNIDTVVAMRGFNKEEINANEFIWEGTAENQVLCSVLWSGYNNGSQLVQDFDHTDKFIQLNLNDLQDTSYNQNILLLAGSDQTTVKKYMPKLLNKLNKQYSEKNYDFKLVGLEDYINKVKENKHGLKKLKGDFRKAQKQRVHNSIAGTRTDIKQANYHVQSRMEKLLEPMSVIGYTFDQRYEQELITHCWKRIIENHAHDSICSVCVDSTHSDMLHRISEANDNISALHKANVNNLVEKIRFQNTTQRRPIIVFNLSSHSSEEFVEVEVDVYDKFSLEDNYGNEIAYEILSETTVNLKDYRLWLKENPDDYVTRTKILFKAKVGGIGYRTYYLQEGKRRRNFEQHSSIHVTDDSIGNNIIQIQANPDGTINYINHNLNKQMTNLLSIIDEGNAGDSYDFSPPLKDESISSTDAKTEIKTTKINAYTAEMQITQILMINKYTNHEKRSEEKIPLQVRITLTIVEDSEYIDVNMFVDNTAYNHRLSLQIPNFSENMHYREGSFGDVLTENYVDEPNSLEKGWKELYYPIYSTQRYVYDKNSKLAVFNKGIPSYEIKNGKDLKVHLLTTMDYMGKTDLLYRPGRRSGAKIHTPDSLMMGENNFNFRMLLFNQCDDIYKTSDDFQNGLIGHYIHKPSNTGHVTDELSTFSANSSSVSTSALMKCQFSDGIIWRIKNMTDQPIKSIELQYNQNLYNVHSEVNLLEEHMDTDRIYEEKKSDYVGEEYEGAGEMIRTGRIQVSNIKPNEIVSLKFLKE
ncbi:glycoside hydrolase family 38 N-terminal domain-containing protein [Oceanobacillus manasiensis]|uniref:glycoside hydrolase family 38 N-terminal domain-containing protein n=1 Tax=Oceanobacillus manasiensis TaxID=586413 RepID=UPI0005A79FE3|nr:hypothetical protein [Oceanobacillus manasiensis]